MPGVEANVSTINLPSGMGTEFTRVALSASAARAAGGRPRTLSRVGLTSGARWA